MAMSDSSIPWRKVGLAAWRLDDSPDNNGDEGAVGQDDYLYWSKRILKAARVAGYEIRRTTNSRLKEP